MNRKTILIFLLLFPATMLPAGFLSDQLKNNRVSISLKEKEKNLAANLAKYGLEAGNVHVLFVVCKEEGILEVFAKSKTASTYRNIATYRICSSSGGPGPKRRAGDGQVPEGFYHIDRFNPSSNFYLSLGINYPNQSDKIKSNTTSPGGDIFIHGSCVTIGCMPMTDDKIKEIYLYAVYAKDNGQQTIPVYIFPFRMTEEAMEKAKEVNTKSTTLLSFWKNIKTGYDLFEAKKESLSFSVTDKGDYKF